MIIDHKSQDRRGHGFYDSSSPPLLPPPRKRDVIEHPRPFFNPMIKQTARRGGTRNIGREQEAAGASGEFAAKSRVEDPQKDRRRRRPGLAAGMWFDFCAVRALDWCTHMRDDVHTCRLSCCRPLCTRWRNKYLAASFFCFAREPAGLPFASRLDIERRECKRSRDFILHF